jgi:hypothetical protein
MSLFANTDYRWRETYFVLFEQARRPTSEQLKQAFEGLGPGYQITAESPGDNGNVVSLTIVSPYDFAAMDISYVSGEDVTEQVSELISELSGEQLSGAEQAKMERLPTCDARFDIYHFERIIDDGSLDDQDEYMDPGSLLVVLERLVRLCDGISVDPQTGSLM